jgi:hypothetical protein
MFTQKLRVVENWVECSGCQTPKSYTTGMLVLELELLLARLLLELLLVEDCPLGLDRQLLLELLVELLLVQELLRALLLVQALLLMLLLPL